MRCFHPISAWQQESGSVVFAERGNIVRSLRLRCGQCIGCRLHRSEVWAVRCVHESRMHKFNSFVTLTYDDEHIPERGSLRYKDFQDFCKRVRSRMGPFRFFMAGEYGEATGRPHFHSCMFGLSFPDGEYFKESDSGEAVYTSRMLQSLWPVGFSSYGAVTFNSAAYVARYVCKKVTGRNAERHYERMYPDGEIYSVEPEFAHMSLRPGIGESWFKKFYRDVTVRDGCIVSGAKHPVPRYYDELLKDIDPYLAECIGQDRQMRDYNLADFTPERLAVQELCAKARLAFKRRSL